MPSARQAHRVWNVRASPGGCNLHSRELINFEGNTRCACCRLVIRKNRPYFGAGSMNAFTTMLFGCMPAGTIVNRPYSPGSNLRGLRL